MTRLEYDVLVIGSGIAGLSFALHVAGRCRVAVVTKKERATSSTNYARGGIAAVMSPEDTYALHVRDTLLAGAGLCHRGAVEVLVREGPARVRELMEWGARFTAREGGLSLGREGGHSRRRIVHAADLTGREIERALLDAVAEAPGVDVYEDHGAIDLLVGAVSRRCVGARVLDHRQARVVEFRAAYTLLATGGTGYAYRHTTNPEIATGDGVAMAYRAGAEVANLEFVQFHPTALYPAEGRATLISEAVRGEGAVLVRRSGAPLMEGVHPLGSLATRDIVARAIDLAMRETGDEFVLLDLSPIPAGVIEERFPNILAECAAQGIDIRREPIPVVPAAHYSCGGVRTDVEGRTTLPGLYAAGETAFTGVHGANRLASNSLLEALVFSARAARSVTSAVVRGGTTPRRDLDEPVAWPPAEPAAPGAEAPGAGAAWEAWVRELRDLMWRDAGIVRDSVGLADAEMRLEGLADEVGLRFHAGPLDAGLIETRNLVDAARLIVRCARMRRESRGLHFMVEHPHRDNEHWLRDTVLVSGEH